MRDLWRMESVELPRVAIVFLEGFMLTFSPTLGVLAALFVFRSWRRRARRALRRRGFPIIPRSRPGSKTPPTVPPVP